MLLKTLTDYVIALPIGPAKTVMNTLELVPEHALVVQDLMTQIAYPVQSMRN